MDDHATTLVTGGPGGPSRGPKPGEVLAERYEVEERLSRDPLVATYRAVDQETETTVLVRLLDPALFEGIDPSTIADKLRNALGIGGKYLPGLLDVEVEGGRAFVVEPLPSGASLREVLRARSARGETLGLAEVLPVVAQLAAALEAIPPPWHHGNVTAERVWLDPERVQLTLPFALAVFPPTALGRVIGGDVATAPETTRTGGGDAAD